MQRLLLQIGCTLLGISAWCQQANYSFRQYTRKDGLSDNYIRNIYQDNRGYLWINSNEGLNRFDGLDFRRFFRNENDSTAVASNISDRCVQLNVDELLIHTYPVMSVFNMTTQLFRPQKKNVPPNVISISEEPGNNFWMVYSDKIIQVNNVLDIKNTIPVNTNENFYPVNIHRLKNGKQLLVTMNGIFYLEEHTGHKTRLPALASINDEELYFSFSYYHPASNTLYAGGWSAGVYKIDLSNNQAINLRRIGNKTLFYDPVNTILKDSHQRLWIGTINGLLLYDEPTGKQTWIRKSNESNGISDNHIRCLYEDRDKNIWIGTVNGLNKLNEVARHFTFFNKEFELKGHKAEIYDIARLSNSDIIIATYGNGLFKLDEKKCSITPLPQKFIQHAWVVSEIDKELYVGGHQQLIKADLNKYRFTPAGFLLPYYYKSDLVLMVHKDRNGDTWYSINGNKGLLRKKAGSSLLIHYNNQQTPKPFPQSYFNTVAEDEKGNSWWGVNKRSELVKWKHETENFQTIELSSLFKRPSKIRRGINCLFYENGHLWIGTDGAGLYDFDTRNQSIREYTINEGIIGEYITQIIADNKNRLWIGTRKGLSCLLPDRNTFINFAETDGLPEIAFNDGACLYDSTKNIMYMGARYYMLQFNPDQLLNLRSMPGSVFIDEIFINGIRNTSLLQQPLQLKYDQNNIQLNFSAVDFNNAASLLVEYKLEGLRNQWEKAGQQRTLHLMNLDNGSYALHLRVKKPGSNEWKELNAPVVFTIVPPFWKTWWFKTVALGLFAVLLVTILGIYYRRKIELQKMLLEKQKAIVEERNRIAADMHDDLGAGVTRIKFLAEDIEDHLPDSISKEELKNLKNSANEVVEKMSEIIWAMNEKNNSLEDLVFYVRSYSVQYCQENKISCSFQLPEKIPAGIVNGETRRNIFLTVKECLHNVVKHAAAKNIFIEIKFDNNIRLYIRDDGKGFEPDEVSRSGNGIINMQKRMAGLNGRISFEKNNGTNIIITVPL